MCRQGVSFFLLLLCKGWCCFSPASQLTAETYRMASLCGLNNRAAPRIICCTPTRLKASSSCRCYLACCSTNMRQQDSVPVQAHLCTTESVPVQLDHQTIKQHNDIRARLNKCTGTNECSLLTYKSVLYDKRGLAKHFYLPYCRCNNCVS